MLVAIVFQMSSLIIQEPKTPDLNETKVALSYK
jgi:hypothetical protein